MKYPENLYNDIIEFYTFWSKRSRNPKLIGQSRYSVMRKTLVEYYNTIPDFFDRLESVVEEICSKGIISDDVYTVIILKYKENKSEDEILELTKHKKISLFLYRFYEVVYKYIVGNIEKNYITNYFSDLRILNRLFSRGIFYIEDLIQYSPETINMWHGLGRETKNKIINVIEKYLEGV